MQQKCFLSREASQIMKTEKLYSYLEQLYGCHQQSLVALKGPSVNLTGDWLDYLSQLSGYTDGLGVSNEFHLRFLFRGGKQTNKSPTLIDLSQEVFWHSLAVCHNIGQVGSIDGN